MNTHEDDTKLTAFSDLDWMAWSGAETFADGSAPMIRECNVAGIPATVIAHGPGVFVHAEPDSDAALPQVFAFDCDKAQAIQLARALPFFTSAATLMALGFERV